MQNKRSLLILYITALFISENLLSASISKKPVSGIKNTKKDSKVNSRGSTNQTAILQQDDKLSIDAEKMKNPAKKAKKNITRRYDKNTKRMKLVAVVPKGLREQTVAELEHNLELYLKVERRELAVKYLEMLIPKLVDPSKVRDRRLQLADLYFDCERYQKAGSLYDEYYEAYPGHSTAEYALWRAILAKHRQIGACDQDRVTTHEVLALSQRYLQNKAYQKYRTQVADLSAGCDRQLLQGELGVFEHYFRQGYLAAAQRRLDHINNSVLPKLNGLNPKMSVLQDLLDQARAGKHPRKLLAGKNIFTLVLVEPSPAMTQVIQVTPVKKTKPYVAQF